MGGIISVILLFLIMKVIFINILTFKKNSNCNQLLKSFGKIMILEENWILSKILK